MAFMTKNAQTRINDITDDIVALTPGPQQNAMRGWLTNHWATSTGGNAQALKGTSDILTMTDVTNPGDKAVRAKRRALIVLEALKAGSNLNAAKQGVINLAGGALDARIAPLVARLAIQADQDFGAGTLIQNKFLMELKAQPTVFLQNNRLLSGAIGGGAQAYFFYEYSKDQYKIDPTRPAQAVHAYQFNAVSIPGVFWLNVPGRGNAPNNGSFATIAGKELTGPDVMISTMFSGCSFCFKRENVSGKIFAAHIMPDDGAGNVAQGGGAGLARQLAGQVPTVTAGNFTGTAAGPFRVYGAGWSNLAAPLNVGYPVRTVLDQFMNIIGIRTGGAWEIYSQHILNNTQTVHRIH
ncbi:MAG: hypothetical protein JO264_10180 [Acidisphaera sp.]|nr:hypothetical protein [Acidisphaera sp.]